MTLAKERTVVVADLASAGSAVERALAFVVRGQLATGLFPTLASRDPELADARCVDSVYISTYIVHVLAHAAPTPATTSALAAAAQALAAHGEPGGLWRFFGRAAQNPPPDFDDTCCALVALHQARLTIDTKVLALLARAAFPSGGYGTWVHPGLNDPRRVDAVVNANILYYLAVSGQPTDPLARFLVEFALERQLSKLSAYALSDPPAIYTLMRTFCHGPAPALAPLAARVPPHLLAHQAGDGSFGHELDTALSLTALLDAGHRGEGLEAAGRWLLRRQRPDGGWLARTFFCDFQPTYYGSEELTTALCAEALAKLTAPT